MKKPILILSMLCAIGFARAQQLEAPQIIDYAIARFKPQQLIFLVSIDNQISKDIIPGKFFIRDHTGKQIDEMPFNIWVGRLEMSNRDYRKLFKIIPQDTLHIIFANNNFQLDTDYVYEVKIPHGMINDKYLILNIYNQKEERNKKKYVFPGDRGYVIQVESPGFYTPLKLLNKK
jgi:hypothetical protein